MNSYDWSKSAVYKYLINHMYDGCCSPWPFAKAKGYAKIRIPRKSGKVGLLIVSRLVCEIVNGDPPEDKPFVRHLCGKGHLGCFSAGCLVWASRAENEEDKIRHGTLLTCEKHNMAKLTWPEVLEIRRAKGSQSQASLGKKYGVSQSAIYHIHANKTWVAENIEEFRS